ncbi:MAG: hypothetical protein A2283_19160 [Lentisphaerae bacterium RIFOXYA12_FULL_48_11]|nr:MAG: hypothetical protein A2283_19160 [Lentisphaerae bacterium RIFOXYA12_FULL_48_11]
MCRHDYFRQRHAPNGTDEFIFEHAKANRIEASLKTIINKLIRGSHDLTEDELITFIQHIEIQRLTVPKQADIQKAAAKDFITNIALSIPEVANELLKGTFEIVIKDEIRFTTLRNIVESGKFFTLISRMIWEIVEAPSGYAFVTSDNPVTIYNPHMGPTADAGIGLLGSHVLYPLTPRYCLQLIHPEIESKVSPDYMQPIEVNAFDLKGVTLRFGTTMSQDLAYATNLVIALQAERFLASNRPDILKTIYESLQTGTVK